MNVQDLNIEGLTEKEFHTRVSRMMDKVYEFALRGREELGYDVAFINILGTHITENDGVIASDMSFGSSDMFLSLAMQTSTLEKTVEISKHHEMAEFLGGLFDGEDEEDE
ncbi:hypothetical protein ACWEXK_12435 [Staphylococcus xylosus]|uniref:hypothetical protein n=1 Tax=Staphylococcus xylosus TaxID=1288 RepID=UPI000D1E67F6|nr:hypothetical protein [Staphylococcus xylosus]PTI15860.1 hypothetical protein BU115_13460 [Staphylococcus xylosus]